ncbi:MAG: hypothetical protein EAX96_06425 [Candidatus Lokiarchaeota archaeon]|nr:hypothetical protein [Candidatus Lokiarchaeota archaeon]
MFGNKRINKEQLLHVIEKLKEDLRIVYSKKSSQEMFKQLGLKLNIKTDEVNGIVRSNGDKLNPYTIPVKSGGYQGTDLLLALNYLINYTIFGFWNSTPDKYCANKALIELENYVYSNKI